MNLMVSFSRIIIFTLFNSLLYSLIKLIVFVFYKLYTFWTYPHIHDSYLFGNVKRLSPNFPFFRANETPLTDAFKYYTDKFPRGFLIQWLFWYPIIIITDYELAYEILASSRQIDKGISYTFLEEVFHTGLLTSNGDKWRYRRKLMEPTMGRKMLQQFLPIMKRSASQFVEELYYKADDEINLTEEIDRTALKVLMQTICGFSDEYIQEHIYEHVTITRKVTQHIIHRIRNPMLWITPFRRLYERWYEIDYLNGKFKAFAERIIDEKIKLKMENKEQEEEEEIEISGQSIKLKGKKALVDLLVDKYVQSLNDPNPYKIDKQGLLEEIELLIFAGYDTTSTTIKWTLYCLGLDQEIQEKLYQEVSSFDLNSDHFSDLDYLKNFVYLDQVISEGLRIRPTVPVVLRSLTKDVYYRGYKFPKESEAIVSIFSIHRDAEIYPNPDKFDPERFAKDKNHIPIKAFIPFAIGPRKCLGKSFAIQEMKILIASIVKHFQIIAEKPLEKIPYEFNLVSSSIEPLMVRLRPRLVPE